MKKKGTLHKWICKQCGKEMESYYHKQIEQWKEVHLQYCKVEK